VTVASSRGPPVAPHTCGASDDPRAATLCRVHELSICTSIASLVERHADGRRVAVVHLDVGHLRQVVPETLRYSWEVVVTATVLEGSVLQVRDIPAVIHCRSCGTSTTLTVPVFRCACGSTDVAVTAGEELQVISLDLFPLDAGPTGGS
jgi:hydrogenase nickel incorporation protein HypA/HybF